MTLLLCESFPWISLVSIAGVLKLNFTQVSWVSPSEEERSSSCSDLHRMGAPMVNSQWASKSKNLYCLLPQEQRLFSPPPKATVPSQVHSLYDRLLVRRDSNNLMIRSPHQVHRRLLFAKSRSHQQAVSKTESLKSSEASPGLGPSPAESNKCIITLSSFEVLNFFEAVIKEKVF